MERTYAFTDEAGNHGLDFEKLDTSTHFIVTAIIMKESKLEEVRNGLETVRKKFFQTGEIKSSSVGKNHSRRKLILNEIVEFDFNIFAIVVDKREIDKNSGLQYRKSFYKFVNNLVHKELRASFPVLTICADELGTNDYMRSFCEYVKNHEEYPDLFHHRDFYFEDSKRSIIVQLADYISGTLLYTYDIEKKKDAPNFIQLLNNKILRIENYPKVIKNYVFNGGAISTQYDERIANISLKRAQLFLSKYEDNDDEDVKIQLQVLKYLCSRFINNDTRDYISTKELLNYLKRCYGVELKVQYFRTRIIARLRDNNVIISSSSRGYKLPSRKEELYDFINHGTTIIMPMLDRLKKCRDIIKMDTCGEVDIFSNSEYVELKKYFDIENTEDIS